MTNHRDILIFQTHQRDLFTSKETCKRDLQAKLIKDTYRKTLTKKHIDFPDTSERSVHIKRDLQKTPAKETYQRDLPKRPTKETCKRDQQKRPTR